MTHRTFHLPFRRRRELRASQVVRSGGAVELNELHDVLHRPQGEDGVFNLRGNPQSVEDGDVPAGLVIESGAARATPCTLIAYKSLEPN